MNEGFIKHIQNKVSYHKDRLRRDYIPAIQETFATEKIPPFVEKTLIPERAKILLESLITSEQQRKLYELVSSLPDGQHRWREAAGTPEQGNRHVHDFVIIKSPSGAQLFYVDPEHAMGVSENKRPFGLPRRGDLRPKINVLYSIELTSENEVARVSLLRYRASAIPKDKIQMNKPSEQLIMAKSLLAIGDLPEVLQGKENEVTFQFDFRPTEDHHRVSVRARAARDEHAVEEMLEKLTAGQTLSSNDPLEGQLRRFRAIVRTYFPKYLEENRFKPLE